MKYCRSPGVLLIFLLSCALTVPARTAHVDRSIAPSASPADDSGYFVRQHYLDFLGRVPDDAGLNFWINEIESCGAGVECREVKRINVSGSFYLSIEFQETGFLLERLYKVSYGDAQRSSTLGEPAGGSHPLAVPIILLSEFIPDATQIGQGIIVNQGEWRGQLEANKVAFIRQFVQRDRFTTAFSTSLTPAAFAGSLNNNIGSLLTSQETAAVIAEFGGATDTANVDARARALRRVAENATFSRTGGPEFNRAFVLMQYFGYLRRNPFDSPEATRDYTGYEFWLRKLNDFNGNFVDAEMVKAFISSIEYQARFAAPPTISAQAWRDDLRFLATQLPLLHRNAFFQISPTQFNQTVSDLDRDIPSLSDQQIIARLMQLVALIGDAHTSLSAAGSLQPLKQYPVRTYWFSDGLRVTQTTAPYRFALGAKVVRVGSTDVDAAYNAIGSLISHENDQWVRSQSPGRLATPELLLALNLLPDMLTGQYTLQDRSGQQLTLNVAPAAPSESLFWFDALEANATLPLYRRNPTTNYWFDYLQGARTLYFQYNLCQNIQGLPFTQFLNQMQAFATTHPVDRLIIDLRNNVGGDSSILQPLINALSTDSSLNNPNKLFVIIGRATISSGLLNAISLRQQTKATFVGEPTGGKPNHYGQVASFRLPNSQLLVQYSTKLFTTVSGDPPSLFPDLNVLVSSSDYLNGRDPVVETILAFP